LTDAEIKFRLPARYDDQLTIYTKMSEYSNVRVKFSSEIRRHQESNRTNDSQGMITVSEPSGELLVSGVTRHVWVNREWKAVRIDKEAPDLYHIIKGEA
jgi:acyl-CoA thioester hydrolase